MDTQFTKRFESKVRETINSYGLLSPGEKVLVAVSGGKDSAVVMHLLNKFGFKVEGIFIDIQTGDYIEKNMVNAKNIAESLGIKLHIFYLKKEIGFTMLELWKKLKDKKLNNCMVCGIVKKWLMNKKAKELGFRKIATGHNLDDAAETILMNLFSGNPCLGINEGPMTGVLRDEAFVQRIKPLYFLSNEEIKRYAEGIGFNIIYEPCPFLVSGSRLLMRKHLGELERYDNEIKVKIVKHFLELLPRLRDYCDPGGELKRCRLCGEPSRTEICKMCKLMEGIL
ncbi:hypothetical protein DRN74_03670 [Candidatus Micrarchaeota archaeon]|nr:MAG: hypothetical protein DRN74_03670 [Candidatus Micrarchaeota archaeon]